MYKHNRKRCLYIIYSINILVFSKILVFSPQHTK